MSQPVTYEEVEKAAKISPLACSLVKPPDPDILSGLSVKAQRELIAQHAQQTLSQPSSRSSSRVPSRATSIGDLSTNIINQGKLAQFLVETMKSGLADKAPCQSVWRSWVSNPFRFKKTT